MERGTHQTRSGPFALPLVNAIQRIKRERVQIEAEDRLQTTYVMREKMLLDKQFYTAPNKP